jgi:hypothetical protein
MPYLRIAMSSYDISLAQFYISSTNSHLNCTKFDKIKYEYLTYKASKGENHTLPSYYNYSCSAYPAGSTKGVALHYQPLKKSAWNTLSKAGKVVAIIASIVGGLLMVLAVFRWWRKKHPKPQSELRVGQDEDGVDLGDLSGGVVREEEDSVHRPPQYRRVAMPHEVPSGYSVTLNELRSSEVDGHDMGAPPTYTRAQRRRKSSWNIFQTWVGNNLIGV